MKIFKNMMSGYAVIATQRVDSSIPLSFFKEAGSRRPGFWPTKQSGWPLKIASLLSVARNDAVVKIFLMVLVFNTLVFAGPGLSWEFAGWYGGGCFPNLTFDPKTKGRVYLTSDVAGIYRSDDSAERWYLITKGLGNLVVSQVAVAPSDSNILYAATKMGIYVSRDAGLNWKAVDNNKGMIAFDRPENYRSIAVDPLDARKLCVGTVKGLLFCSSDSGTSWQEVLAVKQFFIQKKPVVAVVFDAQGRMLAAGADGLVRCTADRVTCQLLKGPQAFTDLEISKKSPGTIYLAGDKALWVSNDDGATWKQSAPVPNGNTFRVTVDDTKDIPILRVIWNKSWDGGVLMSQDGGLSWLSQDKSLNAEMNLLPAHLWVKSGGRSTAIAIDPFDPQIVFRADFFSVWRSDDGGASWNEKIVGAPNTVATDAVFAANGELFVSSMDNGLLASADRGKNYRMVFPLKYDDALSGHVWRVAIAGDTVVATSSPWNKQVNQLIVSNDGGKKFEVVSQGLPASRPKKNTVWGEGYPRAIAVDPKNPDIIYLGIDGDDGGGLFISRDRAKTWTRSVGQPGSLRIYHALKVDPVNSKRIFWGATGENGGVYISEDGGLSFVHAFKSASWIFDLDVASDGTIYATADNGGAKLYKSSDHGRSWKLSGDFGQGRALASVVVDPNNPKRVAVSTASWSNAAPCKVHLSNNAGKTWTDITGDLPDGAGASSMTFDPQSNYLYITRYAGSVYRLKI